jgi:hypothetical protein
MGLGVLAVLVGFLAIGATGASAQTTVYNYDDGAAWWNAYGCPEMKVLLPAYVDGDGAGTGTGAETSANHEKRVCVMYDMLPTRDKLVIETFIGSTMTNAHASHKAWWDAQSVVHRQILAGALRIAQDGIDGALGYGDQTDTALTTGAATAFDAAYDSLGALAKGVVNMAGDALSGRGDGMTDAPAIPLVGVGILGLLLAGRGAWIRRRMA